MENMNEVSAVVDLFQGVGDSIVVDVEGIPGSAAEVRFGLNEDCLGSQLLILLVLVLQEIAGIQGSS